MRRGALRRRGLGGIFALGDMGSKVALLQLAAKGVRVIAFIGTQVMNAIDRFRSRHDGGVDHPQRTGDVVIVGGRDNDPQRCAAAIHQDMALRAALAPIGRVRTGQFAAQRSRYQLAVDRLPMPLNVSLLMIVLHHDSMHLLPQTGFIPLLKTGVQTAAGSKPFFLQTFPLTAASTLAGSTAQVDLDFPLSFPAAGSVQSSPKVYPALPRAWYNPLDTPCRLFAHHLQFCIRSVILLRFHDFTDRL
jgi:hypothetical protein